MFCDCLLLDSTYFPLAVASAILHLMYRIVSLADHIYFKEQQLMEQTRERNGLPYRSSASEPKHIADGVTPLRAIAGGLQPHHEQSRQRAQVRRFTALSEEL